MATFCTRVKPSKVSSEPKEIDDSPQYVLRRKWSRQRCTFVSIVPVNVSFSSLERKFRFVLRVVASCSDHYQSGEKEMCPTCNYK